MTSADLEHKNDQLANGKKLINWVTPKISLMEGEATAGKQLNSPTETPPSDIAGPS
jgi:hypothetical protein